MAMLYTHAIGNQPLNTMVLFKMRESVPTARYSPVCNMYCVNGKPRSSLLIESTDSMIYIHMEEIIMIPTTNWHL